RGRRGGRPHRRRAARPRRAHADALDPPHPPEAGSSRRGDDRAERGGRMNLFLDALRWIFSPDRLSGPEALPLLFGQHLFYTVVPVAIAALIAVPLGWLIGHTGRGREFA